MANKAFFLLISILSCATAIAQTTVAAGDILVTFPAEPEKTEEDDATGYRIVDSKIGYVIELTVTHSDLPENQIFDNEINQKLTDGVNKKLQKTIDIKLGRYDGKELHFIADLGGHNVIITSRLFIIGNTVYWLDFNDIFGADLYSTIGKELFDSVALR